MSTKFDCEIVGKIGSMALIDQSLGEIDYNAFSRIGKFLYPGCVWVSSGAVEIGKIDYFKRNNCFIAPEDDYAKSLYAAQGQTILIEEYRRFIKPEYSVCQFLVEHNHFNNSVKREFLRDLLLKSISNGAIPIINYNDPVSKDEIMKMEISKIRDKRLPAVECVDNDETAAQLSVLLKSKYLLILTSAEGLLRDPDDADSIIERVEGKDTSELIAHIESLTSLCSGTSRSGSNGMLAKLQYIREPIENGTVVIIGSPKHTIPQLIEGTVKRTIFTTA